MRAVTSAVVVMLRFIHAPVLLGQVKAQTLVAVWAHADDETSVGPILARYAREGVQVCIIIATDGAQGAASSAIIASRR